MSLEIRPRVEPVTEEQGSSSVLHQEFLKLTHRNSVTEADPFGLRSQTHEAQETRAESETPLREWIHDVSEIILMSDDFSGSYDSFLAQLHHHWVHGHPPFPSSQILEAISGTEMPETPESHKLLTSLCEVQLTELEKMRYELYDAVHRVTSPRFLLLRSTEHELIQRTVNVVLKTLREYAQTNPITSHTVQAMLSHVAFDQGNELADIQRRALVHMLFSIDLAGAEPNNLIANLEGMWIDSLVDDPATDTRVSSDLAHAIGQDIKEEQGILPPIFVERSGSAHKANEWDRFMRYTGHDDSLLKKRL